METEIPIRKIIHIDMDAFFASVEQLDHPEWRGKPIVIGYDGPRGVIAAASYEARKFGVRSAMRSKLAKELCPELIFVPHRIDRYKEISDQIRAIFHEYTDLVEPLSLDEAYLDVTENKKGLPSATLIAREIRDRIEAETGLTASAGISINKFLAKTASDINKPNGQKLIPPSEIHSFLEELPIERFFGIGKVTASKMKERGIFNGADLKSKSLEFLTENFGKSGGHYHQVVRGIQHSVVQPNRIRKSIRSERTFEVDLYDPKQISDEIRRIGKMSVKVLKKKNIKGRTVVLKLRLSDFQTFTRSFSWPNFTKDEKKIVSKALELYRSEKWRGGIRLIGVGVTNLDTDLPKGIGYQLTMEF